MLKSGLDQMITFSLRDVHALDRPGERIRVRTPHSPDIAILRNSILPSLADSAHRNGNRDLHLFEIGRVFGDDREETHLGVLTQGRFEEPSWTLAEPATASFFTLKGVVEALASLLAVDAEYQASRDPRLHPTRQAELSLSGVACGVFGQIHPDVALEADLPEDTFLAELNLSTLAGRLTGRRDWHAISRQPGTRRDVAVLVPKALPFADVSRAIVAAGGDVLERHSLFDVYDGKGIPEGHHSLAIALHLRKMDATFTDEEANQVRDAIVAALVGLGAQPR